MMAKEEKRKAIRVQQRREAEAKAAAEEKAAAVRIQALGRG